MIKQYFIKQKKIAKGFFFTYLKTKGQNYNDREWWDKFFYTRGISDRQTLSPTKNSISAKYHYCSVELLILKHFCNQGIVPKGSSVLDIGSGAGHWIDFYKSLGVVRTIGIDVSESSINHLKTKYSTDANAGFSDVKFYKNNAYLWINDILPENNILVATK